MRPLLVVALTISAVANAFEAMPPTPSTVRLDVVVVTTPVPLTRTVTSDGVLAFKGTLTNNTSTPVMVTRESFGTIFVRSFRCNGKDVPPVKIGIAIDEDPRSTQSMNEAILRPAESLVLEFIAPTEFTVDAEGRFLMTFYRVVEPGRCQAQFEYRYQGRDSAHMLMGPIISNSVSFEIGR